MPEELEDLETEDVVDPEDEGQSSMTPDEEKFLEKFKKDDGGIDYSKVLTSAHELEKRFGKTQSELAAIKAEKEQYAAEAQKLANFRQLVQSDSELQSAIDAAVKRTQGQPAGTPSSAVSAPEVDKLREDGEISDAAAELLKNKFAELERKFGTVASRVDQFEQHQYEMKANAELRDHCLAHTSDGLYDEKGNPKDEEYHNTFKSLFAQYANMPAEDVHAITLHRLGRHSVTSSDTDKREAVLSSKRRTSVVPERRRRSGKTTQLAAGLTGDVLGEISDRRLMGLPEGLRKRILDEERRMGL